MREYIWSLKIYFKYQPMYMVLILFLYIVMYSLQPLELLLIQKLIVTLSRQFEIFPIILFISMFIIVYSLKNVQYSFSLLFIEILENKVGAILQRKLFESIAKVDLCKLDQAEYLLKIERARDTIWYKLTSAVNDVFHFIGAIVSFGLSSLIIAKMGVLYLVAFIGVGLLQNYFLKKNTTENINLMKTQEHQNRKLKYLNNLIQDRNNQKEIRSFKIFNWLEEKRITKFDEIKTEYLTFSKRWSFIGGIWSGIMICLENCIFLFMCYEASINILSIDQLIVLSQGQGQIVNGINALAEFFSDLRKNKIYINEFQNMIKDDGNEITNKLKIDEENNILELKEVSFSYGNTQKAINNINLTIQKGEVIVLIGENGSGKSTLSKIIAGLIKPTQGTVLKNFSNPSAAFQDYAKFEFAVRENIGIGDVNNIEDSNKVTNALVKGQLHNVIEKYPKGLDTILGKKFDVDGIDMSEGQWQKVSISRSFMKDADFIIFDEPSASLDAISEIQQFLNIGKYLRGKSVVLISHRIGIAKLADRILFMKNGEIVEEGTHVNLMRLKEEYYGFFINQAKWYDLGDEVI
ncbi:UNVERIFIED_CONTAM: ABC-type multidrug transport system fused ATPase/permease subunit [Paenibacillus sp. PvR008]